MTPTGPILSIDPGTRCGWCVMAPDGEIVECGTWDLSGHKRRGLTLLAFHEALESKLNQSRGVNLLAYERVFVHVSADSADLYGAFCGVIETVAAAWDIETARPVFSAIKKHATGRGNAKKPEMVAAARARWPGLALDDDNTADACWIADAARLGLHTKVTARKAAIRKAKKAERKLFARGGRR